MDLLIGIIISLVVFIAGGWYFTRHREQLDKIETVAKEAATKVEEKIKK